MHLAKNIRRPDNYDCLMSKHRNCYSNINISNRNTILLRLYFGFRYISVLRMYFSITENTSIQLVLQTIPINTP